jgi:hypothetical protein
LETASTSCIESSSGRRITSTGALSSLIDEVLCGRGVDLKNTGRPLLRSSAATHVLARPLIENGSRLLIETVQD